MRHICLYNNVLQLWFGLLFLLFLIHQKIGRKLKRSLVSTSPSICMSKRNNQNQDKTDPNLWKGKNIKIKNAKTGQIWVMSTRKKIPKYYSIILIAQEKYSLTSISNKRW